MSDKEHYCGCCDVWVEDFGAHEKTEDHKKNKEMMMANLTFDKDIKFKVVVKEDLNEKSIVENKKKIL